MITARDVTRNVACLRGLPLFDLNQYISPLVAAGWLDPVDRTPVNRAWHINPNVAHQFARQREVEDKRKARVAELMGSPRKNSVEPDAEGRENGGQGVAAEQRTQGRHLNGSAEQRDDERGDDPRYPEAAARCSIDSTSRRGRSARVFRQSCLDRLHDHPRDESPVTRPRIIRRPNCKSDAAGGPRNSQPATRQLKGERVTKTMTVS